MLTVGSFIPTSFAAARQTVFQASIDVDGQPVSTPAAIAAYDGKTLTTYIPIYYVDQALKSAGFVASWDGTTHIWNLLCSNKQAKYDVTVGSGNTKIDINGKLIKKVNTIVEPDPRGGPNAQDTVYMPIYYVDQVLQMGFPKWNGKVWNISSYGGVFSIQGDSSMAAGSTEQVSLQATKGGTITIPSEDVVWTLHGQGQGQTLQTFADGTEQFSAPTPGVYTITAAYGPNNEAKKQIIVYGQPAKVTVGFINTVRNSAGLLVSTIQVNVMDSTDDDSIVKNFNGTVQLSGGPNAGTLSNGGMVQIKNGTGTITLTGPKTIPAGTETITSSALTSSQGTVPAGMQYGSVSFSYAALSKLM